MASPRRVPCSEFHSQRTEIAYPHDRQMQELVTQGIKANGRKKFKIELEGEFYYTLSSWRASFITPYRAGGRVLLHPIELEGEFYYTLLQRLDKIALDTDSILDLRECMRLSDRIMEQLRAQGFYG
jgi:hypothetical protein